VTVGASSRDKRLKSILYFNTQSIELSLEPCPILLLFSRYWTATLYSIAECCTQYNKNANYLPLHRARIKMNITLKGAAEFFV